MGTVIRCTKMADLFSLQVEDFQGPPVILTLDLRVEIWVAVIRHGDPSVLGLSIEFHREFFLLSALFPLDRDISRAIPVCSIIKMIAHRSIRPPIPICHSLPGTGLFRPAF